MMKLPINAGVANAGVATHTNSSVSRYFMSAPIMIWGSGREWGSPAATVAPDGQDAAWRCQGNIDGYPLAAFCQFPLDPLESWP